MPANSIAWQGGKSVGLASLAECQVCNNIGLAGRIEWGLTEWQCVLAVSAWLLLLTITTFNNNSDLLLVHFSDSYSAVYSFARHVPLL